MILYDLNNKCAKNHFRFISVIPVEDTPEVTRLARYCKDKSESSFSAY